MTSTQKSHCADKCCKKPKTYLEQPAIQNPKDDTRDVKLAITENQEKLILKIDGMCCASEIDAVKQVLNPLIKGKDTNLAFDLINGKLTIENRYGDLPSKDQIIKAIAKAGLTATLWQDHVQQAGNATFWQKHGAYIMNLISLVTLIVGVVIHGVKQGAAPAFGGGVGGEEVDRPQDPPVATIVVYCVSILTGGYLILPKAFSAVRRVRPDPNFLMTLASAGAIGLNHWFEAASSMYLFSLAGLIENWNMARARKAIRKLMELAPTTAQVMDEDGKVTEQLVENVPINSIIVIRPGEKVPMDSILIIGSTSVNQAPITGESMPVQKEIGDQLFAGTINGDGSIQCRVLKAASDSTLSNIIKKVEEAQSRRAKSDQWIEKFCLYYVPAVMMASVIVAIIPPLASKDRSLSSTWYPWIYKGLEILVISCPCSLVISTPVSIIAGLAAAARSGVLIKGGLYLELASKLNAFAMDKTGTLTNGEPVVQHIIPLNNLTEKEFLKLAIGLEIHSDHPLARAIQRKAKADGIKYQPAEDFQVYKGKGGEGYIDGELFWIGSHRLVHEKVGDNEPTDVHEKIQELEAKGHSTVVIGQNQRIWGLISIADSVRKESKTAIQAMKQAGIKRIVMLTGDNKGAAKTIAESINIDEYRAELLPEDKVKQVEELVKTYKMVAMVGDGVNDAPAMATATIGVAMGAAGSDAAIETADIALMSDDLAKLAWLVKHARSTLNVIYQNVILSLAVKAVFAGLIFGDKSTLWMAILADVGTTFVVVSNALRLINNGSKQRKRERKLKEQEKGMTYRETFCPTEERMEFATPSHDIKVGMPSNNELIAKKGGCCKSKNCKQNSTHETGTTHQEILSPTEKRMGVTTPSCDTKVVIPSSTESVGCCKSKSCKQNSAHETGTTHQEILSPTEKRMEVAAPSCDIKVVMPLNTESAAKKSGCCKSKNCKQNLTQDTGATHQEVLRPIEEKMELTTPSSDIKVVMPSNTEPNAKKVGCCKSKNCKQNLTQDTGATHQEVLRPIEEKMEFTNPSCDIKVAMPSNSESVHKKGGCCKSKNCKQNLTQETATTQSEIIRPTEEKLQSS